MPGPQQLRTSLKPSAKLTHRALGAGALLALGLTAGCAQTNNVTTTSTNKTEATTEVSNSLYELRTYTTNDGKLDALHARFRNHTQRLFEKHGIQNVAYWTPTDLPNTLVYIVAHQNQDTAKAAWAAFVADPEWKTVYAASIAEGRLVSNIDSVFMAATDYSPAF